MVTLVTGGTGFIGSHLVGTLVSKGNDVRMLVRKISKVEKFKILAVDFVYWDITDRNTFNRIENSLKRTIDQHVENNMLSKK